MSNRYYGPKLDGLDLNKPFCIGFKANGGFIKVTYSNIEDGDTAYFNIDHYSESVRFNMIDALPKDTYLGELAKNYLEEVLKNAKEIILESDPYNDFRDLSKGHRILAWVWADGKLTNYLLVRNGYAKVAYIQNENMKYIDIMKNAEKKAKKEKLGIHNVSNMF